LGKFLISKMKKYKALFCSKCHKAQMTAAKERLRCISCGKTTKFTEAYVFQTKDPATASWAVRVLTKEFRDGRTLQELFNILENKEKHIEAYHHD
jgi:hypothetical protein